MTDRVVFSWLGDVFVHPDYRGRGLGRFLVRCVGEHPAIAPTKQLLATRDAHAFYEQLGFRRKEVLGNPAPGQPLAF